MFTEKSICVGPHVLEYIIHMIWVLLAAYRQEHEIVCSPNLMEELLSYFGSTNWAKERAEM